jgi:hypothetical protein
MTTDESNECIRILIGSLILTGFLGALIGASISYSTCRSSMFEQAVKHGAGHWRVEPSGATHFEWNKPEEIEKNEPER